MRLVTYRNDKAESRLGALIDEDRLILDLYNAADIKDVEDTGHFSSMQSLIEAGPQAWDIAKKIVMEAPEEAQIAIDTICLLAPLPCPVQMRDFASFEAHSSNAGRLKLPDVWYEQPIYYKCNRLSVIGPDQDVKWPTKSQEIDYELELAAVIGKGGCNITRENALDHIFGYTIFNDLSARDWQFREMKCGLGPAKGKDFNGGNVLGPCIVTTDEIPDPHNLQMTARVNGEEWSRNSSSTIYHRFERMIEFLSEDQTLFSGEIIGSGTVGSGCGFELGRYLKRGDTVELEIEKIGRLRTKIT